MEIKDSEEREPRSKAWFVVTLPLFCAILLLLTAIAVYFPYHVSGGDNTCSGMYLLSWLLCKGSVLVNTVIGNILLIVFLVLTSSVTCFLAWLGTSMAVTKIGFYAYSAVIPVTFFCGFVALIRILNGAL
jgi:flagellar basal body-associated protein FliL